MITMTDLQIAKSGLAGHTICLCKDGNVIYDDKHGIAPIMNYISEGVDLRGYSVADLIVGRAATMLFVRCGNSFRGGKAVLERYEIPFEYGVLTEKIINRSGTDICPMEKAVVSTENPDEAYSLLEQQIKILSGRI